MASAKPQPIWGWTAPVRGLLIILTVAGATWLLIQAPRGGSKVPVPVAPLVVDPNNAPRQVLLALPRLGPSLVDRIIAARQEAPFRSIDDLDVRVRGLGPATIKALRPHLRIAAESSATAIATPTKTARATATAAPPTMAQYAR